MRSPYRSSQYIVHPRNPIGSFLLLVAVFLIFSYEAGRNYSPWIPVLFIIVFLGSCFIYTYLRKKQAQGATITPSPPSQTDPPLPLTPYGYNSTHLCPRSDSESQPLSSTTVPPQQTMKLCPACGAQLDEEILKQLVISCWANCKFCGNCIQK